MQSLFNPFILFILCEILEMQFREIVSLQQAYLSFGLSGGWWNVTTEKSHST